MKRAFFCLVFLVCLSSPVSGQVQTNPVPQALKILETQLSQRPHDPFVLNNLAWLLITVEDRSLRDCARALRLVQEALVAVPYNYHVWSTLAEAHYRLGHFDKSLLAAQEAVRLAGQQGVSAVEQKEYLRQVTKARQAAEIMSLIE